MKCSHQAILAISSLAFDGGCEKNTKKRWPWGGHRLVIRSVLLYNYGLYMVRESLLNGFVVRTRVLNESQNSNVSGTQEIR